jgi:acyl-CoA synthetase (NDP forming)
MLPVLHGILQRWQMIKMKECESAIQKALREERSSLLIDEAYRICNLHHIPTPKFRVVIHLQEAVDEAKEIGYPVALKILSPQIIHKSDVGGVILNVEDENELRTEYEKLIAEVNRREPSAKITGVLVEKMMAPSTEVIVGGIRDSQFGPAVMFGMGGMFTEVYDDVAFRVAPIDRIDALNLIHGLKGSKVLEGIRGKPPADIDSVVNVLTNVSDLMMEHDAINQLDLNPVIVYPDGLCAVDSRIILKKTGGV